MEKADWLSEDQNIKKAIDEAREKGIRQGKHELIGIIALMPNMEFLTSNTKEAAYIKDILTQARNNIYSQVFNMTLEEIEISVKGYTEKETLKEKTCCECLHGLYEKCSRLCPISCPRYEKPCGKD